MECKRTGSPRNTPKPGKADAAERPFHRNSPATTQSSVPSELSVVKNRGGRIFDPKRVGLPTEHSEKDQGTNGRGLPRNTPKARKAVTERSFAHARLPKPDHPRYPPNPRLKNPGALRKGLGPSWFRHSPRRTAAATADRAAAPRSLSCLWCVSWWPPNPCPFASIRGCLLAEHFGTAFLLRRAMADRSAVVVSA